MFRSRLANHMIAPSFKMPMQNFPPNLWLCFALLAQFMFLAGCAVNPATGELDFILVSEAEEQLIGKRAYTQITTSFGGIYDDPRLSAYLRSIGRRLADHTELPDLEYTFTILDSPIANAFAAPGGHIFVTRGLLALPTHEAQLAGVLGHELGHINARHTAQRMTLSVAQTELCKLLHCDPNAALLKRLGLRDDVLHLRRFSRDQEFEADSLAVRYLTRAGYPPNSMARLLETLLAHGRLQSETAGTSPDQQRPSHTSTHPLTAERLDRVTGLASQSMGSSEYLERDTYLNAIDGLLYGNHAGVGFIVGRQYANPRQGITFEAPEGFALSATSENVTASGPHNSSIILEAARVTFSGTMLDYLTTLWARDLPLEKSHTTEINGMESAIGWMRQKTKRGPLEFQLAAIRVDSENIYRFLTVIPLGQNEVSARQLHDAIYSFRRLSTDEAELLKPRRLRVVEVQKGDSLSSLIQRMAVSSAHGERFAILNGLGTLDTEFSFKPGRRLKLITQ